MNVRSILASTFLLSCLFVLCYSTVLADDAADLCDTPGNLLRNCRFDNGFRGVGGLGSVAQGFGGFVISGRPDFNGISCDSPEPPCQRVWSDGETWEAGIYQQVANVTPGQGYRARIGWFTAMCDDPANQGRVGIDPTGGTNPNSPDVVWNPWIRLNKSNSYGIQQVKTQARNSTITAFFAAKFQMQCSRGNAVWFDAAILVPDGSAPPAGPPAATATTPPTPRPAPTNTRPAPTRTPTRPPEPTNTPPPPPTSTATATATASPSASPTPTATDTETPVPTSTRRPTATPTAVPETEMAIAGVDGVAIALMGGAVCSLVLAMGLGAFTLWFWRRS